MNSQKLSSALAPSTIPVQGHSVVWRSAQILDRLGFDTLSDSNQTAIVLGKLFQNPNGNTKRVAVKACEMALLICPDGSLESVRINESFSEGQSGRVYSPGFATLQGLVKSEVGSMFHSVCPSSSQESYLSKAHRLKRLRLNQKFFQFYGRMNNVYVGNRIADKVIPIGQQDRPEAVQADTLHYGVYPTAIRRSEMPERLSGTCQGSCQRQSGTSCYSSVA